MKEYLLKADVMALIDQNYDFFDGMGEIERADAISDVEGQCEVLQTYQVSDEQVAPNGQWLPNVNRDAPTYDNGLMIRYFHCSVCNGDISDRYGKYRYCPHCGAKMEE